MSITLDQMMLKMNFFVNVIAYSRSFVYTFENLKKDQKMTKNAKMMFSPLLSNMRKYTLYDIIDEIHHHSITFK